MIYAVYYQRFLGLLRPAEVKRRWLNFSHRRVRTLTAASPDEVYQQMQAEIWSTRLIRQLRLEHTSLSVGDVVHSASGEMWVCDFCGWRAVPPEQLADDVTQPALWLVTDVDDRQIRRLNLRAEWACLPATAVSIEAVAWIAFADLVSLARLIEQRLGWSVCIDLGNEFYETPSSEKGAN